MKKTTHLYPEPRIHAGHVELAVARLIGWRQNTIVPNVSWGLGLNHECDMLVLDAKDRLTEIEIKVTLSDLKNDFKKMHGHTSKIISRLVYAVPENLLAPTKELVPKHNGIITVMWNKYLNQYEAHWVRVSKHNKFARPTSANIEKLMSLGCMRIWSLKEALILFKLEKQKKQHEKENNN
jgi:hypothetical protein